MKTALLGSRNKKRRSPLQRETANAPGLSREERKNPMESIAREEPLLNIIGRMTLRGSGKPCQHWKMWSLSELIGWRCDHKKSEGAPLPGSARKDDAECALILPREPGSRKTEEPSWPYGAGDEATNPRGAGRTRFAGPGERPRSDADGAPALLAYALLEVDA